MTSHGLSLYLVVVVVCLPAVYAVTCSRCGPGTYVKTPCTRTEDVTCQPCPPGKYMPSYNNRMSCLKCRLCHSGYYPHEPCTDRYNTHCRDCHSPDVPFNQTECYPDTQPTTIARNISHLNILTNQTKSESTSIITKLMQTSQKPPTKPVGVSTPIFTAQNGTTKTWSGAIKPTLVTRIKPTTTFPLSSDDVIEDQLLEAREDKQDADGSGSADEVYHDTTDRVMKWTSLTLDETKTWWIIAITVVVLIVIGVALTAVLCVRCFSDAPAVKSAVKEEDVTANTQVLQYETVEEEVTALDGTSTLVINPGAGPFVVSQRFKYIDDSSPSSIDEMCS